MNTRLKNQYLIKTAFFACIFPMFSLVSGIVFAGSCSPGIPCTGYSITANPTAGTDANYNGPKTGQPTPYTGGSCDGNFMNQIISNAYLGASREVIMSEQLINKPDSVLAYTCFDQLLAKTAHNGGVFSETQTFGAGTSARNVALKAGDDSGGDSYDGSDENDGEISPDSGSGLFQVPPPSCSQSPCEDYTVDLQNYTSLGVSYDQRLDTLLNDVVMQSLNTYLSTNFNHTYLGGSSSISRTSTAISSTSYNCSEMQTVWQIAQCADFGEYDRFRTFSDLVRQDPRAFPTACSPSNIATDSDDTVDTSNVSINFSYTVSLPCPEADGNNTGSTANTGITNAQIDVANNCNYTYADFDILEPLTSIVKSPVVSATPSAQDSAKLLSGHPTLCSDPLPTGVLVLSYQHSMSSFGTIAEPLVVRYVHYDHVCPNPGCYYIPVKVPMPLVPGSPLEILNIQNVPAVASVGVCSPL